MTKLERECFARLYRDACFGNGADVRRSARASLEAMCKEAATPIKTAMEDAGLCLRAYFATRPCA